MFERANGGLTLVLLSALLASACRSDTKPRAEESSAKSGQGAASVRDVELEPVAVTDLEQIIEASGTLAADVQVTLAAKVPGRVASIAVDLSSPVKQGQIIAQIEPTDYAIGVRQAEAALAQARAQLGLAGEGTATRVDVDATPIVRQARATLEETRANAKRLEALAAQGLTPEAELTTARASQARAEAALDMARQEVQQRKATLAERDSDLAIARQRLNDTVIRSPLDGFVQTRWVNPGEYLVAGAAVAQVVRVDPLRLRLALPEREAQSVRQGQAVDVSLDGSANAPSARGVVARVAPSIDADSRSLLIEADIPNPGNLRPGHFVRARIRTGARTALTIPEASVVTFAGLQKVILVQAGKAIEQTVTTGTLQAGRIEITTGLNPGDQIVRTPGNLQQGQPVRLHGGQ